MKNSNQNTGITIFEEFVNFTPDSEEYTEQYVYEFLDSLKEKNLIDKWEIGNMGLGQQTLVPFYMTNEQIITAGFRNDGYYDDFSEWLQKQWEEYFA